MVSAPSATGALILMENAKSIQLVLESEFKNLPLVGSVVRSLCSEIPLNETARYQIELSVVEAVTNVIKHAYGSRPGHRIYIEVSLHSDWVRFRITDTGRSISPVIVENLNCRNFKPAQEGGTGALLKGGDDEALAETGWGLKIIDCCMDEVTYSSSGGENTLTITRYFNIEGTGNQIRSP